MTGLHQLAHGLPHPDLSIKKHLSVYLRMYVAIKSEHNTAGIIIEPSRSFFLHPYPAQILNRLKSPNIEKRHKKRQSHWLGSNFHSNICPYLRLVPYVATQIHYLQKKKKIGRKNYGRLIFGHFFPHFGQISDKIFGHFDETLLKQTYAYKTRIRPVKSAKKIVFLHG